MESSVAGGEGMTEDGIRRISITDDGDLCPSGSVELGA